jgi:hypothetical protein
MLSPDDRWLDELVTPCFECGQGAMHQHHVVPRSLGGTKTVPLCEECHRKVHVDEARRMIASGLSQRATAKALGLPLGTLQNALARAA